jgi:hypothetical protein
MDFFLEPQNFPFTVSIAVMIFIAALEGVGALIGLGISNILESILPDIELDVDGPNLESNTTLSHFLGWLRVGEVPFLVLLIVFLTSFGLIGLIIQQVAMGTTGHLFPSPIVALPAILGALPCMRLFGGMINRIMPRDETEAVSTESFKGRVATLTLGTATKGSPAEAKLIDTHNQSHYIMVEPDDDNDEIKQGERVLILNKAGSVFKVIRNPNKSLEN